MRRGSLGFCLALAGCTALPWQEPPGVPAALLPDRPAVRRDELREAALLAGRLSVDDAVRFALANNRDITAADRAVLIARDRTTEQWTRVLPTVTAEVKTTTRSNDFGNDVGFGPQVIGDRSTHEVLVGAPGQPDTCSGDSGSPSYLDTPRGPIVFGVASRGRRDASEACGEGTIHTLVPAYLDWIAEVAGSSPAADAGVPPDAGAPTRRHDDGGCTAATARPPRSPIAALLTLVALTTAATRARRFRARA